MSSAITVRQVRHLRRSWKQFASQSFALRNTSTCPPTGTRKAVRVRFAPSPTGHLHLGGFRTALINFLFARKHNGKFILRIEDTDQMRAVQGASDLIEKDLEWLNVPPDESPRKGGQYGPYTQSERLHYYQTSVDQLIRHGHAYRCFCTDKRLDLLRKNAVRQRTKFTYDGKCKEFSEKQAMTKISNGESYCIRFKLPPPPYQFEDIVQGSVTLNEGEGDFVILKSDRFPTYHLACVIDDHLMEITHVLRGVEWSVSTGKHLSLYRALGIDPPQFAHLPVLRNSDGSKLSKRQGDISIDNYRKSNYYPYALINFVLGIKEPIYSMEEIIDGFVLSSLSAHDRKLDFRELEDLNQLHLKHASSSGTDREYNLSVLKSVFPDEEKDHYERLLNWCPDRVAKLQDIGSLYPFLSTKHWEMPDTLDEDSKVDAQITDELSLLVSIINSLQRRKSGAELNSQVFKDIAKENGLEIKLIMLILRRALCGREEGPPVKEIVHLIGWKETMKRLHRRAKILTSSSDIQINQRS